MTKTKTNEATTKQASQTTERIVISPPNFHTIQVRLVGTAPYMQARFAQKAMQMMMDKHAKGSQAGKDKTKKPRDFDEDYRGAMHISSDGWNGVPAAAIRNACIDACRMAGFKMTHARMSVFADADGLDAVDGTPLIKLHGKPERTEMATRNATGVADIRIRPMWRTWHVDARIKFDADQFSESDVINLLLRAGEQVGIGEGRPFSKSSNGLGYGTFRVDEVRTRK